MWKKIKGILAVVGAVFTIAFCTFVLVFLRRRDSDRRGSDGVDGRDSAIQDGIADSQGRIENVEGRIETVEGRIETVEESVGRCEEHLHRAEAILRNAIRRSREGKEHTENVADNDSHV